MTLKFILGLALIFSYPFMVKANNIVYFSPRGKCEKNIIDKINATKKTLDIAVYSINNDKIVDAILKAKNRGVKVRILTDKTQAKGPSSKFKYLYDNGVNIRVHSKFKIEHNKFAIYDKEVGSTGSFNWTNPAQNKNSENCLFFENDANSIEDYQKRFDYLWQINTKKKSDKWIEKHFEG